MDTTRKLVGASVLYVFRRGYLWIFLLDRTLGEFEKYKNATREARHDEGVATTMAGRNASEP